MWYRALNLSRSPKFWSNHKTEILLLKQVLSAAALLNLEIIHLQSGANSFKLATLMDELQLEALMHEMKFSYDEDPAVFALYFDCQVALSG